MLVLTRKKHETIILTSPDGQTRIRIVQVDIRGDKSRIGIEALRDWLINRGEIQERIDAGLSHEHKESIA
jgi:carbon storage regulator CsrA